jgi:hypothetical protein
LALGGDMPVDLSAMIKENQIIVFVVQSKSYSKHLEGITRAAADLNKGLCYVSLNKPYKVMQTSLKNAGVSEENIYFVDAVSSKVGSMEPGNRVIFVSSPQALTELSIAINKCLGLQDTGTVLFDSLSTLLVYEESSSVIKFVHSVISTLRVKEKSCIFTVLKEDLKEALLKDLAMFADKIEELV